MEKLLTRVVDEEDYLFFDTMLLAKPYLKNLSAIIVEAKRLLAGAHAEEKE